MVDKRSVKKFAKKIPFARLCVSRLCALKNIFLYGRFLRDWKRFKKLNELSQDRFRVTWSDRYPCLNDNTGVTNFSQDYVYHTAWAMRVVEKIKPKVHVDVSSALYFSAMLSTFVPVEFYDYRPAELDLPNLKCERADLCNLHFDDNTIESLSCMSVIEHIGLGRYGDPIDPNGDLRAISEIKRVVARGGNFILNLPISSEPKICYNAHRIYTREQIISYFDGFELVDFVFVPEDPRDGGLVRNPSLELIKSQINYGGGCFWFRKI